MAKQPWFKLYAADYLLDEGIDSLALEARAVLLAMWCLCHIDGACPADPEEIARKARLPLSAVTKCQDQLKRFFELRDGRLFSRRMEAEKLKSETARTNANKRYANGSANGNADCTAQSQSQSHDQTQDQGQNQSPHSENLYSHSKEKGAQENFDARDLRKFSEAGQKLKLKLDNGWGANLSDDELFAHQCVLAGVHPEQMRGVFARIEQRASA